MAGCDCRTIRRSEAKAQMTGTTSAGGSRVAGQPCSLRILASAYGPGRHCPMPCTFMRRIFYLAGPGSRMASGTIVPGACSAATRGRLPEAQRVSRQRSGPAPGGAAAPAPARAARTSLGGGRVESGPGPATRMRSSVLPGGPAIRPRRAGRGPCGRRPGGRGWCRRGPRAGERVVGAPLDRVGQPEGKPVRAGAVARVSRSVIS